MLFFNNRQQPRYDNFNVVESPQPTTKKMALPEDAKAKSIEEWKDKGEWINYRWPSIDSMVKAIPDNLK